MSANSIENNPVLIEKAFEEAKTILSQKYKNNNPFGNVKLVLVLDPKHYKIKPETTSISYTYMSGEDYFQTFVHKKTDEEKDVHTDENGWDMFGMKGYCAYAEDKVYIGLPYPSNADIPLQRAIIHELGHHIQKIKGCKYISDNEIINIILEYHNIMFHENLSNCPGTKCKFYVQNGEKEEIGKRYNYSLDYHNYDSAKSKLNKGINQLKFDFNAFMERSNIKKCYPQYYELIEEMFNATKEGSLNHILLFNCYNELTSIKH